MSAWVQAASDWLWGPPMLILVLGTGGYLLVRLRAIQFRRFGQAVGDLLHRREGEQDGDISPFAALMTAVGGIVGNGNLAVATGAAVVGGVKTIARVSEVLAPLMGLLYLGAGVMVLFLFRDALLPALELVFTHAVSPVAAGVGFLGAGVREAFRFGVARGVYSNEAGTGSVPIVHASARTSDPARQGRVAMLGVFLDTLVVSSTTGLVLIASGAWTSGLDSTALTADAFARGLGGAGGAIVLCTSLLFGLSTLVSWAFYGEQSAVYLFGVRARKPYRLLYCLAILGGAAGEARAIWAWGDLLNGVMAVPNLIALVVLAGELARRARTPRGATGRAAT
jgi:AGCS family alanine or glycine:cation symporter